MKYLSAKIVFNGSNEKLCSIASYLWLPCSIAAQLFCGVVTTSRFVLRKSCKFCTTILLQPCTWTRDNRRNIELSTALSLFQINRTFVCACDYTPGNINYILWSRSLMNSHRIAQTVKLPYKACTIISRSHSRLSARQKETPSSTRSTTVRLLCDFQL